MDDNTELYEKNSDLDLGYRAFTIPTPHGDGVLIATTKPDIAISLSKNSKFERFKQLGEVVLFNSKDISNYLTREGLPPVVQTCIMKLFAKTLT